MEEKSGIRPYIRVRLAGQEPFFGKGTVQILHGIEETGSVRMACQQMGMSYSKGWKILKRMEQELGFAVVLRKQGGPGGGSTQVTEQGKDLLARFEAYEREVQESAAGAFEKYFFFNSENREKD